MAQHFRVDAHVVVFWPVFLNGEVVLCEKVKQPPKQVGRKVNAPHIHFFFPHFLFLK